MKNSTFLLIAGAGAAAYLLYSARAGAGTTPETPFTAAELTLSEATTPIRTRGVLPVFADISPQAAISEGVRLQSYQGASRALKENLSSRPLSDFAQSVAIGRQIDTEKLSVSKPAPGQGLAERQVRDLAALRSSGVKLSEKASSKLNSISSDTKRVIANRRK